MAKTDTPDAVGDAMEQIRTPLLAALGAGDLATQAVVDVVNRAKSQVTRSSTQSPVGIKELREKLSSEELRALVDTEELRRLVDVDELRSLVDNYTRTAVDLYEYLASAGEGAMDKLRAQPQVGRALQQLEDVLSTVARRSRSVGEKTARRAESAAGEAAETATAAGERAAEAISEAGDDVAAQTRSTAHKTASKADAAKPAPTKSARTTKAVRPEQRSSTGKTDGTSRTQQ